MEYSILVFWSSLLYSIQQLYMLVFFSSFLSSMSLHNMRCWSSVILYPSVHPPHPFSSCWRGHNITFFHGQDETISLCICGYGEYIVFYGDNNCDLISWYGDSKSLRKNNKMNGRFIVNVMFMGTRNDSFLDLATVIVVLCEVCVWGVIFLQLS